MAGFGTFLLDTDTDNRGSFSIPHFLDPHFDIYGITIAVQNNQNQNFHVLEASNAVDNQFWFNETKVEGRIDSPNFHNSPVRIIVFAQHHTAI